jgi:Zn-dependent protease
MECNKCGREEVLPFRCAYCGDYFCSAHRLPEAHDCRQLHLARNITEIERGGDRASGNVSRPATMLALKSEVILSRLASMGRGSERLHLAAGGAIVAGVVFSIVYPFQEIGPFLLGLVVLSLVASFLAHELAHKLMALRLGYWASFRLNLFGSLISIVSIILPFKFVAPGAVMIFGPVTKRNVARIAAIGPLVNIAIAMALLGLLSLNRLVGVLDYRLALSLYLVGEINALMGLINLIPIGPLDGLKIITTSARNWVLYMAAGVILYSVYLFMPRLAL